MSFALCILAALLATAPEVPVFDAAKTTVPLVHRPDN